MDGLRQRRHCRSPTDSAAASTVWQVLTRLLPILQWLPAYHWRNSFFADLSAGLTMAVFSVPTGIAHAGICGVAPVYGLYTAIFPSFFYLGFGHSKHNALGGFAILSLMTRSAIERIYRVAQHTQLLLAQRAAIAAAVGGNATTAAANSLAIGSAILLAGGRANSPAINDSTVAVLTAGWNVSNPIQIPFLLNDQNLSASAGDPTVRLLSNANASDSMVFGLADATAAPPPVIAPFDASRQNVNPFLQDAVNFAEIGVAPEGSNPTYGTGPNGAAADATLTLANLEDAENLTMVIVQQNGSDKAVAIFINTLDGDVARSTAALVVAAAASRRGTLQKKSIVLDAQVLAAAATVADVGRVDEPKVGTTAPPPTPIPPADLKPIHIATAILFVSGLLQILMGVLRLDFLSCYLSEQVMSGFVVGGCVHVFFSLVGDVLGLALPQRSGRGYLYYRAMDLLERWRDAHSPTALISACSIGFLLFGQQILEPWLASVFRFPIPYELILVIVGITATNFAKLSKRHSIIVVGHVPTNFPASALPRVDLVPLILVDALSVAITAVAIHLTVVKVVESRYRCKVNSCHELYSLGLSGLLASLFPVFPVTSVFARTLVGEADRNCTQMTIFFSSMALLAVILYVGPVLEYLPKCILASMILVSLGASFAKLRELRGLWPLFKFDFIIFVVSFLLTICYGMPEGLTFTVIFAVFTIVVRDQWPKWHFLSHDAASNDFRETPKENIHELDRSGACVLRYDAPLIFPNVHKFLKVVEQGVKQWEKRQFLRQFGSTPAAGGGSLKSLNESPDARRRHGVDLQTAVTESVEYRLRRVSMRKNGTQRRTVTRRCSTTLILDCSGFSYVDHLGLCTLKRVYQDFIERGVVVKFAAPKAILMRMFRETNFMDVVPSENVYPTVRHAVDSVQAC